jgi:hypothetical protein
MAVHLTCFIGMCLQIASRLYRIRKAEKRSLSSKAVSKGGKYRQHLRIDECEAVWSEYKRVVNKDQVRVRQKVWFFQFVVTLLCIALIYPSEFIYYVRKTFAEQRGSEELVALLDYVTFYLFWVGVYHCPQQAAGGHGYFYNLYGYLVILGLLVIEKNAQQWALNRFGCTADRVSWFAQVEGNLERAAAEAKGKKGKQDVAIADQVIVEEIENEEEDSMNMSKQRKP